MMMMMTRMMSSFNLPMPPCPSILSSLEMMLLSELIFFLLMPALALLVLLKIECLPREETLLESAEKPPNNISPNPEATLVFSSLLDHGLLNHAKVFVSNRFHRIFVSPLKYLFTKFEFIFKALHGCCDNDDKNDEGGYR